MHCRAFTRPLPRVRDPLRKKKRKKENSPTSQSFRTSSAVSVCVTPPLPSTLRWMQPTSSLGVLPTSSSGLLPSSPPTILHTLAILKTYIHLLPPSLLMLRLELSVHFREAQKKSRTGASMSAGTHGQRRCLFPEGVGWKGVVVWGEV